MRGERSSSSLKTQAKNRRKFELILYPYFGFRPYLKHNAKKQKVSAGPFLPSRCIQDLFKIYILLNTANIHLPSDQITNKNKAGKKQSKYRVQCGMGKEEQRS